MIKPPTKLVLASHNPGKIKELQAMLGDFIHVKSAAEFSKIEPEETGLSFIENALIKARYASKVSGLPALADDSGLTVNYLRGAPGINSARYAGKHGDDNANIEKLLTLLKFAHKTERSAQFICCLALVLHSEDPLPTICEGRWSGSILQKPQGDNGFGYDPIFWVPEKNCSSAELSSVEKNQLSHRAIAMKQLKEVINAQLVNA